MFFFRSRKEGEARIGDADWPPYFQPSNLLELELRHKEPFTDVDANWITSAPVDVNGKIKIDDLQWVSRYWAGENYSDDPAWERLAKALRWLWTSRFERDATST